MRILVPTDFSDASVEAVRYAINLATKLNARITLLHVFAPPIYPIGPDGAAFIPGPEAFAQMYRTSEEQLEQLLAKVRSPGFAIDKRTAEGPIAAAIVQTAADEKVDMIVMGTHGRTGIKHLLLGSIAEAVVRTATTPVLTVRGPKQVANAPFAASPTL